MPVSERYLPNLRARVTNHPPSGKPKAPVSPLPDLCAKGVTHHPLSAMAPVNPIPDLHAFILPGHMPTKTSARRVAPL